MIGRSYLRSGVWGWGLEAQEAALRDANRLDPGRLYIDELAPNEARWPARVDPAWLPERTALLREQSSEPIFVATLLALAMDEVDLIAVLAAVEAQGASIVALDSGLELAAGTGVAGAQAALQDWQRAKREAQTRPGRMEGNRKAAELARAKTREKLPAAEPLWRSTSPDRPSVEEIAERAELSVPTLYRELGHRPPIQKATPVEAG